MIYDEGPCTMVKAPSTPRTPALSGDNAVPSSPDPYDADGFGGLSNPCQIGRDLLLLKLMSVHGDRRYEQMEMKRQKNAPQRQD